MKKQWANEWDPALRQDPWYTQTQQGSIYDFIAEYKYSLSKVMSVEQIL